MTKRRIQNKYTSTYEGQPWTTPKRGIYRDFKNMDKAIDRSFLEQRRHLTQADRERILKYKNND